jgi:N-acyl-D-amino-acid deacylase
MKQAGRRYELLLRGGTVHDGLGSPGITAEVAVDGDRVSAVGRDLGRAARVIEVDGLAVAPGFVDPHSHSDLLPLLPDPQPFKLLQGVTTEIVGNCGVSFAPLDEAAAREVGLAYGGLAAGVELRPLTFADYLDRLEAAGPTNHVAALLGHGTLRLVANGTRDALRPGALAAMGELADEAFAAGAVGLSSGLIYAPGTYADTDELVRLATVAHRWQRVYATHLRDEGEALEAALDEAVAVAEGARVRLQVSHCKAAGPAAYGKAGVLLEKLRAARAAGVDARGDQYPYRAAATVLAALLPASAKVGGADALVARLREPGERARLRQEAEVTSEMHGGGVWRDVRPEDVLVTRHRDAGVVGRTLAEVAGAMDAWEALCRLLLADPAAMMVLRMMREDDVQAIMRDPLIAVGSDSLVPLGLDHPRTWGCFPRFLGRYVRELGVVSWPEAVRKVTSAAAVQFGLEGRGWLGPGAVADITVFDPATVGHAGTYTAPDVPPEGIPYVVLAGRVVVDGGAFTGGRHGRVLRAGRIDTGTARDPR